MLPSKILYIDADQQLRRYVRASLTLQDVQCLEAATFEEGLKLLLAEQPDIVVLDCDLAEGSVVGHMQKIREWSKAQILLVSRDGSDRKVVEGLDAGAHDYIIKPFAMNVFLARIGVAWRCALEARASTGHEPQLLTCGNLEIDVAAHHCRIGTHRVDLTPKEFELLRLLVQHKGKVLTHRFILESLWGKAHAHDVEYVRVFIMQLRAKLERSLPHDFSIRTEIGIGYRIEEANE
jgi:two-component system KDP operon response regulator KdpE